MGLYFTAEQNIRLLRQASSQLSMTSESETVTVTVTARNITGLPSQSGVKGLNGFPEKVKQTTTQNHLKTLLKRYLVSKLLYSIDKLILSHWEK